MMPLSKLRVVSLVPSWTETLIAADVDVVGRTRFCIHPSKNVTNIAIVGGTKDIDLDKLCMLKPDLVVLDKQENTEQMASQIATVGFQYIATDVTGFASLAEECRRLGSTLSNSFLTGLATRYKKAVASVDSEKMRSSLVLTDRCKKPASSESFEYVIWRNPFMVVGSHTFIADNLKLMGIQVRHVEKYPKIEAEQLKKAYCFFSSEPFPFLKFYDELLNEGFRGCVIDGEKLSWFGIRNLNFLESLI